MRAISIGSEYAPTRVKAVEIQNTSVVKTSDNTETVDSRFIQFWDLMDTINVHGYTKAAMSVIGRTTVGTWWGISKHPDFENRARSLQSRKLKAFYSMQNRPWDNIKDYFGMPYKLMMTAMYLRYFGQAGLYIVRDGLGNPLGLDFIHGFLVPNVDSEGYFKSPAFIQYPENDKQYFVEYTDPRDVVYITNPDWQGYVTGGTDVESLKDYTLPLDIYLQTAAREYMQNRNKPEAIYSLSPDVSSEAFDEFVSLLQTKYSGAANVGKNPIVVQGEMDIKELGGMPDGLPYQESRKDTRTEILSVAGVPGAKLGISEDLSSANLRELRREFHEASMIPIFTFIEEAFYEQIHVREFGYPGWIFTFNNPDFLTEVERATVDMRYYSIGVYNPNEIRNKKGLEDRTDPKGDLYVDQLEDEENTPPSNTPLNNPDEEPGSPPEGQEEEPDDPSNTGEPTNDDQDPPRGDNHDDETRDFVKELKTFRKFLVKRLENGKKLRPFESDIIPGDILRTLNELALEVDQEEAKSLIDELIDVTIGGENYDREEGHKMVLH